MRQLFAALALVTLAACAASPKLADYPRREIDRPLTLPKGLASWSILGQFSQEKYRYPDGTSDTDRRTVGPIPLKWQTSLSDDWNLVWYPIPVAAIYQIRNDASATTGLILGYGLKLGSGGYSTASVGVEYFHRQKLSSDLALEFTPGIQPWFPIGGRSKWDLQASVGFGPFWQVGETLSLNAGGRAVLRKNSLTVISGGAFDGSGLTITTHDDYGVVFPVYFGMIWSFSRQWDFGGTFNYSKLAETQDYSRVLVDFEFRHFW